MPKRLTRSALSSRTKSARPSRAARVLDDGPGRFEIRPGKITDAGALARLSNQLGYPASSAQVRRRLAKILADRAHAVFTAESPRKQSGARPLAGWVHVYVERTLESEPTVEFGGLVVEETRRGLGVGRLLVQRAERWAHGTGCSTMTVRSNVLRTGAHAFYRRLGYRLVKNQRVFRKRLERDGIVYSNFPEPCHSERSEESRSEAKRL